MTCKADQKGTAVLLHAAGAGPKALRALSRALENAFGRVVVPPLPRGASEGGSGGPLIDHIEVAKLALARPPEGADDARILFGHSFGGLVALLAGLDGAEVDALILYEPIVMSCLDENDPADVAARQWDRNLIDYLSERTTANDPEPGVARFVEAYNEVLWESLPEGARRAIVTDVHNMVGLTQAVHHQALDRIRLRRFRVPTLVLHGDRSPDAVKRMAVRLHTLLPDAQLVMVEDAGHMAPALEPNRVLASITSFLATRSLLP